ncbi:AF4/FMR2 family member lilli-like isoform X2 [Triticum urartu]|uniref:AF4/FMR2 family member lilli-like isoform X2 n=1 Tax=Triticum urartu TaxID=4572 RepID=UPI00204399E2|nr:AF4/FMR2 family member lilli-like isoform X2 [Triticum urartu]
MAAADDAVAADIICSLRGADLAGWTPPWSKRGRPMEEARELSWPAVARGKRSRRRSPASSSATAAAGGKAARCARSSPASPLDYSAGSASLRSGASTSGGEDGAFCSPWHRRAATAPATAMTKTTTKRLPEVQQLVRSLAVENESLHEEMRELQRACSALSKENDKLETRIEQSNSRNEAALKEQKGKQQQQLDQQQQQLDQQQQQSPHDSFALPDLNLPAQDGADGSAPC